MTDHLTGWSMKGFGRSPDLRVAGQNGLTLYRCWGGGSSGEVGGYFSVTKPTSVYDAETRFNIVDWGNLVQFVSTFELRPGVPYWIGPVFHRRGDIAQPAEQVYLEAPVQDKVRLVRSRERLQQDVFVSARAGHA